ncbi:MAG: hypothetical protein AB7N53_14870, partial [Candidatus Binatia bacterium]
MKQAVTLFAVRALSLATGRNESSRRAAPQREQRTASQRNSLTGHSAGPRIGFAHCALLVEAQQAAV